MTVKCRPSIMVGVVRSLIALGGILRSAMNCLLIVVNQWPDISSNRSAITRISLILWKVTISDQIVIPQLSIYAHCPALIDEAHLDLYRLLKFDI